MTFKEKYGKYLPGARILKTGIAVVICMFTIFPLSAYLGISSLNSFYAALAAIITIQANIKITNKVGSYRIISTILGAITGILFFYISIMLNISPHNYILIFIGLVFTMQLCVLVKMPDAALNASILYLAPLTFLNSETFLSAMTYRTLFTIYGVVVAIFVNRYIKPPKYHDNPKIVKTIEMDIKKEEN